MANKKSYAELEQRINELENEIARLSGPNDRVEDIQKKFRVLVEAASFWINEVDSDGIYTYVNPLVKGLLGVFTGRGHRQVHI